MKVKIIMEHAPYEFQEEYICPLCKGKSMISIDFIGDTCSFCEGDNTVNWIEYIFNWKKDKFVKIISLLEKTNTVHKNEKENEK